MDKIHPKKNCFFFVLLIIYFMFVAHRELRMQFCNILNNSTVGPRAHDFFFVFVDLFADPAFGARCTLSAVHPCLKLCSGLFGCERNVYCDSSIHM